MPKRIYKYEIEESGRFAIEMYKDAEILRVNVQTHYAEGAKAFLWAMVDLSKPLEKRQFFLVPTGIDLPLDTDGDAPYYVASFQLGREVWHLFEPYEDAEYPAEAKV